MTTSRNGKGVIQVSGHVRLVNDILRDIKTFVGQIIHTTVKFSFPGRQNV